MAATSETKIALLLVRFRAAAQAHHQAVEALDEAEANAHARIVSGLHAALLREGQEGQNGLLALTDSEEPAVAGMAAVYAIRFDSQRCLMALRRVAAQPGLLGFRASVAIERWETGQWEDPL